MKGITAEAPQVTDCVSWDCIRIGAGLPWETMVNYPVLSDAARIHSVSGVFFLCLFLEYGYVPRFFLDSEERRHDR